MTEAGFAEPAADAAHAFRAIMKAMARPGIIADVAADLAPPAPLRPAAAAIALTLCDFQSPVWLSPRLSTAGVRQYIKFHTGAPLVADHRQGLFVFIAAGDELPPLDDFMQGTHEYPDRSATLVIEVGAFGGGDVEVSGPGIASPLVFGAAGIGPVFWQSMAQNHARFPLGVDVIFVTDRQIAALPRSSAICFRETV